MKIAMISQPMCGFSNKEIKKTREKAAQYLKSIGYDVLKNTFFEEEWTKKENLEAEGVKQVPVKFLAKSIESMSHCDAVYFCEGWEKVRGCRIEHDIAMEYDLVTFHEGKML